LGTVAGRGVAFEGAPEGLVAFSVPDALDRLLEDVAEDALLSIFAGTSVAEGGKAAGEDVAA